MATFSEPLSPFDRVYQAAKRLDAKNGTKRYTDAICQLLLARTLQRVRLEREAKMKRPRRAYFLVKSLPSICSLGRHGRS